MLDLYYDDDAYVFARQLKNETVIIAFNRDGTEKKLALPVGAIGLKDGAEVSPLIGTRAGDRVSKGQVMLSVPSKTAVAYVVR